MFGRNKNKNPEPKTQTKNDDNKNNTVVFHTMQDDLKAMNGKITLNEKESDANIEKTELKKENEHISPFSGSTFKKPNYSSSPASSSRNKYSVMPENPNVKGTELPVPEKILGKKNKNKKKKTVLSFLAPIIIILIIASISLGLYLLWKTVNSVETTVEPLIKTSAEKPGSIERYSSENPNYLSIDTESASAEDISQMLMETASEIKEFKNDGPFEFIVTDANNNPLSFSIFAYLFEINLSKSVLNSFDESFSLYFYRDGDNMRTGLDINTSNKETAMSEITKEENALPEELQPLFLSNSFSETGKSFSASQYKDFQIKYINLNEENTLSVDYSIVENQLVIGTSKNTIRAIIDRIETEQLENSTEDNEKDVDIEL